MTSQVDITGSRWEARLRQAGLRVTRPRVMVLDALARIGGHCSAGEVAGFLAGEGTPLTRGTVYNVLADLAAVGLTMVADHGPGTTVYEINEVWHHHFVCRSCGTIIDVPCVVGHKPCLRPDASVGEVDEAQIIFRGLCDACRRSGRADA